MAWWDKATEPEVHPRAHSVQGGDQLWQVTSHLHTCTSLGHPFSCNHTYLKNILRIYKILLESNQLFRIIFKMYLISNPCSFLPSTPTHTGHVPSEHCRLQTVSILTHPSVLGFSCYGTCHIV